MLLIVFGYAANFSVDDVPTAVVGAQSQQVEQRIQPPLDIKILNPATEAQARDMLVRNEVQVAIVTGQAKPLVLIDGASLFTAQSAVALLQPPWRAS